MSRHKFEIVVEVDDEALAEHDVLRGPPPNDVEEWDARDIFVAYHLGIIDSDESDITWYAGTV